MSQSSNLPPGCTDRDIERSQGADYPSSAFDELSVAAYICPMCGAGYQMLVEYLGPEHRAACEFVPTEAYYQCRSCDEYTDDPQDHYTECSRPDMARDEDGA